ncbi:uncharacterized protein VP01_457g4 [Puccinia sorghi]|uniref:DUF913 domain-containing protein n=1 Tax=Puccinia sorghi TaxID=27349 RepID=A0A0L6UQM0_9BASI|nr:uncharacterized protein VP01_457g4 [Puccinia sorghi]
MRMICEAVGNPVLGLDQHYASHPDNLLETVAPRSRSICTARDSSSPIFNVPPTRSWSSQIPIASSSSLSAVFTTSGPRQAGLLPLVRAASLSTCLNPRADIHRRHRVLFECFKGAIFLHQGRSLLVLHLNHPRCFVSVRNTLVHYLTQPIFHTTLLPLQVLCHSPILPDSSNFVSMGKIQKNGRDHSIKEISDKIKASITTTTSTHGLSPPAFLPCPQLSCSFRSPASSSLSAPAQYNLVPKLSLSNFQDPATASPNSSLCTVSDTTPLAHLPANYTRKFKDHNSNPTHFETKASGEFSHWDRPSIQPADTTSVIELTPAQQAPSPSTVLTTQLPALQTAAEKSSLSFKRPICMICKKKDLLAPLVMDPNPLSIRLNFSPLSPGLLRPSKLPKTRSLSDQSKPSASGQSMLPGKGTLFLVHRKQAEFSANICGPDYPNGCLQLSIYAGSLLVGSDIVPVLVDICKNSHPNLIADDLEVFVNRIKEEVDNAITEHPININLSFKPSELLIGMFSASAGLLRALFCLIQRLLTSARMLESVYNLTETQLPLSIKLIIRNKAVFDSWSVTPKDTLELHTRILQDRDHASVVGSTIDELIRHQPLMKKTCSTKGLR